METLRRDCPLYLNWLADMGAIPATERRDRGSPTVWMVRAGEGGVHAPIFVQQGAVFLGWGAAGDVSALSLEAVSGRVTSAWPEYGRRQRGQVANALYKFALDMQAGDVVVTPEPASRTVLLGEVAGDYRYLTSPAMADFSHARPVTWRARISRDQLSYGAKNSLSTQITLSQPSHVAEFLRLLEAHAGDEGVSAVPSRSRRVRDLLREIEYACIDPLVKYAFPVTVLPEGTPLEAVCDFRNPEPHGQAADAL
jgi:predicted Mrr-cat superfamily restriction endonuclease